MKDIHFLNISYNKKKIANLVDSFLLLINKATFSNYSNLFSNENCK